MRDIIFDNAAILALALLILLLPWHRIVAYGPLWPLISLPFIKLHLVLRHRRRKIRNIARIISSCDSHFLVDTACLLNWPRLTQNFDTDTSSLMKTLLNLGRKDGLALKPGLKKASGQLKRLARRYPADPGPLAYLGWCLALLSHIAGREAADGPGDMVPEDKMWNHARELYLKAMALAPAKEHIAADWARALEERGQVCISRRKEYAALCLDEAFKQYEFAAAADVDLKAAWRGQGRVLFWQVMELERGPALELLSKAVDFYEQARSDGQWTGDFYSEFGQVASTLAQYQPERSVHYFCYAARLFVMASEADGENPALFVQAGRALHQAAFAALDNDPLQAEKLYRESLAHYRTAIELSPDNAYALLGKAKNLTAIYSLMVKGQDSSDDEESSGEEEFLALLEEAAGLCEKSASIAPTEDVYFCWANVLSLKAENGGERSPGRWWAATARKYAAAAAFKDVPNDRAAVNWHNWGFAFFALAETRASVSSRLKLLKIAADKYEKAAELNGGNLITLKNWADVLSDMADLVGEPLEAERLNGEAEDKLAKATVIHPDKAEPWCRWSSIVQNLARKERNPSKRRDLWQAALDKLEKGVRADEGFADAWIMWGQALSEIYREGAEYERPLLISGIIEKYEKALELEPNDINTWSLLGRARLRASEIPMESSVCGSELNNTVAAVESFKKAWALGPAQADRWSDWGLALFRVSQAIDNEASALVALKEAAEKYETAVALEPENGEYRTGLGHVLYQWGWRLDEQDERRVKFKSAYEHCSKAGGLAPYDPVIWRNWGKVTEALASIEKDPLKSFDWQSEADEKYFHATTLAPGAARFRRH